MTKYLLETFIFFTIITLSFALPPAMEEITEGVEKSLIARHVKNLEVYSEQLARLILDAETVLTDQDTEDKDRIPIYYGAGYQPSIEPAHQFIDKPVNMLKLREFVEEPFDHIAVHKYGFGGFCDKAGEEQMVRGIADLAVVHKITKNPAILSVFKDVSKDPILDKDAVAHRKIARGIFSKLSGEDLGTEKDDLIDKSVDAIIADNKCASYMENLQEIIDYSSSMGPGHVPFEMSPYKNHYPARLLPLPDRFHEAKGSFPWIHRVILIDSLASKIPASEVMPSATASRAIHRTRREHKSHLWEDTEIVKKEEVITEPVDAPSDKASNEMISNADNSPVNDAVRRSRVDREISAAELSSNAVEAQESSSESAGDKKDDDLPSDTDLLEDFVKVDDLDINDDYLDINDDYLSDESYGFASSEGTPQGPLPRILSQKMRKRISISSYDSSSSMGNSIIVNVPLGGVDPYHID